MMMMMQAFLCWVAWRNSVWVRHSDYLVFDVLFSYLLRHGPVLGTPLRTDQWWSWWVHGSRSVKIPTRPHVGCGDVTLDPMDTHGGLDLRGCLTCGCAAYGTVLRPGSRSIRHVSIFRFRSAGLAVVTKVAVSLQCQNLLLNAGKMFFFGKLAATPRNWHLQIFYIKGGVLGGLFENTSSRHGGFFGAALGAPGKCVRESGECQPAAVAYAKAGVCFSRLKREYHGIIAICSYVLLSHSRLPVGSFFPVKKKGFLVQHGSTWKAPGLRRPAEEESRGSWPMVSSGRGTSQQVVSTNLASWLMTTLEDHPRTIRG